MGQAIAKDLRCFAIWTELNNGFALLVNVDGPFVDIDGYSSQSVGEVFRIFELWRNRPFAFLIKERVCRLKD